MAVNKVEMKDAFFRALYMVLFLFISYFLWFLILGVSIFQFIATLVMKAPDDRLAHFGSGLGQYYSDIIHFLTYSTEQKPFPFDTWPGQRP